MSTIQRVDVVVRAWRSRGSPNHDQPPPENVTSLKLPILLDLDKSRTFGKVRTLLASADIVEMSDKTAQNSDTLILTGRDGTECEEWIRSIHLEAFNQGRYSDKAWIAALASTRISGRALRWYCQQSEDITSDWTKLRVALLDQYPTLVGDSESSSS
ncbi:hypothetical protein FS837_004253, partial [Tulasnella sp. UAMH 9824]